MLRDVIVRAANAVSRMMTRSDRYISLPGVGRIERKNYNDSFALSISAVWAAVTLVAGHLSSIPLNLYRRLPNNGREKAFDHPLWATLHDEPYPGMSRVEFIESLSANQELHGVAYVMATVANDRLNLLPFNSLHVRPDRARGVYEINDGERPRFEVPQNAMLVFPALTFDGANPVHVSAIRRRSLTLAVSYEERAEAFNRNGAVPSGVAIWGSGYNTLKEVDRKRLESKWEELYNGVANTGGTVFLPEGSDFKTIQFNPEALQMLGSRQYSATEIARWFRVPPHKVGDLTRATFNNIEHQSIEYVTDSLFPRATKIESIMTMGLIPVDKRREYFIEFNLDGLQRGDFKSRMEGYAVGRNMGLLSPNDIARLENMNPISSDDGGDTYLVPLNMIPAGPKQSAEPGDEDPAQADPDEKIQDTALNGAQVKSLIEILAQVVSGSISKETAKQLISIAFPRIDVAKIDSMLADIEEGADPEVTANRSVRQRADQSQYLRCRAAATGRRNITNAYAPAYTRAAEGIVKAEIRSVRDAAEELLPDNLPGFLEFLDQFYSDNGYLPEVVAGIRAVVTDYAGQIQKAAIDEIGGTVTEGSFSAMVSDYVENSGLRYIIKSRQVLKSTAMNAAGDEELDPLAEVTATLDSWEESRAATFGRDEPIRAEGAFSRAAWISAGVLKLMWIAFGKSCPSCASLDGKVVGITETFATKGETVAEGTDSQITVSSNITHPQLHAGCDCGLGAVVG